MASRKIIFLIAVGILWLLIILGVVTLANKQENNQNSKVESLSIWVVWGTTEEYLKIFAWFNELWAMYKNTLLDVRVFPSYSSYRETLLATLDIWKGPDVFMIEWDGDEVLASKSVPVPEPYVNLSDFEKRYDDIFLPLLGTMGEGETLAKTIKGVPLGYETLWVFYNKAYFPSIPKTWNDIGLLYSSNKSYFPVNIWLWPRYTPDATDIIAYFFLKNWVHETKDLPNAGSALEEYLRYGNTEKSAPISPVDDTVTAIENTTDTVENLTDTAITVWPKIEEHWEALIWMKDEYDETWHSTIDSFMRGKIGMVIGFPSTIREIEKAQKRAWESAVTSLILTERIPQNSLWKSRLNIARYKYLAVSAKSANPKAAADFLSYLMNQKTLSMAVDVFPYLISPDRTISQTQWQKSLSTLFTRAYLGAFIPEDGESLFVYNYWVKNEYEKIFEEYLDRKNKIDINNTLTRVKDAVECKIESTVWWILSDKCLK